MQHNNFTIARFILATLVLLGHFKLLQGIVPSGGIHGYGDFAVDAFFVISGYLVYGSFDNKPDMRGFYIRRFFRIYPLYALIIFIQAAVMLNMPSVNASAGDVASYLGANLIFANFLQPSINDVFAALPNPAINASLWTLKIEVGFYLLLPLLWFAIKRFGLGMIATIYIASTFFFIIASQHGMYEYAKQLPGQLRFFAVGMALYHGRHLLQCPKRAAAILAIALFALCSFRHAIWLAPIYPVIVGGVVFLCALRLPAVDIKFDISYGIYLLHAPLTQLAIYYGYLQNDAWFIIAFALLVFALAWLAERFVEKPMVALGKRLTA